MTHEVLMPCSNIISRCWVGLRCVSETPCDPDPCVANSCNASVIGPVTDLTAVKVNDATDVELSWIDADALGLHLAAEREAELGLRLEPARIHLEAMFGEVTQYVEEILPDEMRQHELVMQLGAPADQGRAIGRLPEPRDQGAQQQLLGEAHLRVRRHFERAELDQSEPPRRPVG